MLLERAEHLFWLDLAHVENRFARHHRRVVVVINLGNTNNGGVVGSGAAAAGADWCVASMPLPSCVRRAPARPATPRQASRCVRMRK